MSRSAPFLEVITVPTPLTERIWTYLYEEGSSQIGELATIFGFDRYTIRAHIALLEKQGRVESFERARQFSRDKKIRKTSRLKEDGYNTKRAVWWLALEREDDQVSQNDAPTLVTRTSE